jgi:hypothetical protein
MVVRALRNTFWMDLRTPYSIDKETRKKRGFAQAKSRHSLFARCMPRGMALVPWVPVMLPLTCLVRSFPLIRSSLAQYNPGTSFYARGSRWLFTSDKRGQACGVGFLEICG